MVMAIFLLPPANLHDIDRASAGWVKATDSDSWVHSLPVMPSTITGSSRRSTPERQLASEPSRIVRERAAANILLNSGFVGMASASRGGDDERTIRYSMRLTPTAQRCSRVPSPMAVVTPPRVVRTSPSPSPDVEVEPLAYSAEGEAMVAPTIPIPEAWRGSSGDDVDRAGNLAAAVVAVEATYRTAPQRWLELRVAQLGLALFGRLPDFSLGLAQLRPSTVRALPKGSRGEPNEEERRDDVAMLAALSNDCRALRLAAAVLYDYMREAGTGEETAAARYVGRSSGAETAIIDYVPIVIAAVGMLE